MTAVLPRQTKVHTQIARHRERQSLLAVQVVVCNHADDCYIASYIIGGKRTSLDNHPNQSGRSRDPGGNMNANHPGQVFEVID